MTHPADKSISPAVRPGRRKVLAAMAGAPLALGLAATATASTAAASSKPNGKVAVVTGSSRDRCRDGKATRP
jgi:hypothetical protein